MAGRQFCTASQRACCDQQFPWAADPEGDAHATGPPRRYVQEVPSAVKPIAGVGTSTAAFIGVTDKGPVPGTLLPTGKMAMPTLITSYTEIHRTFGGFRTDSFLTYAVQAFFQNGGRALYIVRIYTTPSGATLLGTRCVAARHRGRGGRIRGRRLLCFGGDPRRLGNNIWVQVVRVPTETRRTISSCR